MRLYDQRVKEAGGGKQPLTLAELIGWRVWVYREAFEMLIMGLDKFEGFCCGKERGDVQERFIDAGGVLEDHMKRVRAKVISMKDHLRELDHDFISSCIMEGDVQIAPP